MNMNPDTPNEHRRHRLWILRPTRVKSIKRDGPAPIQAGSLDARRCASKVHRHNRTPRRFSVTAGFALMVGVLLAGCAASPPTNLRGVSGGTLAPCPPAPHCVSSEAGDAKHKVAPLQLSGDQATIRAWIVQATKSMLRTHIKVAKGDYIHATYTSRVFGFVDDVEFVIHDSGRVDVRSSSRVGYYDFGVNRSRVATLRKKLQQPPGGD